MEKQLKVLILNGSPRPRGNTALGIGEMVKVFEEAGVSCEVVRVANLNLHPCIACMKCREKGACVFQDEVAQLNAKFEEADGLVVASPVYYAAANPALTNCLTRMFYSSRFDKTMKVGAAVVCARRSGCTAAFDELNKFFTISGMPGEAEQDGEGLCVLRTLARNMVFLMRSIALGKEQFGLPEQENRVFTNFIR